MPIHLLELHVTNRCNGSCHYCFEEADPPSAREKVPVEVLLEVVESAISGGFTEIVLTGGEPSIRDDLPLLFRRLPDSDIKYRLYTNGIHWSEELYAAAIESKAKDLTIIVSIDSLQRQNHRNQKVGPAISTACRIKHRVDEHGQRNRRIEVHSTVTRDNVSELSEMHSFFAGLDIPVEFNLVRPFTVFVEQSRAYDQFTAGDVKVLRSQLEKIGHDLSEGNRCLLQYLQSLPAGDRGTLMHCAGETEYVIVDGCGYVWSCEREYRTEGRHFGNVTERPLSEILADWSFVNFVCEDRMLARCSGLRRRLPLVSF